MITIKITFRNNKSKNVLPKEFWVSRKWLKTSDFSSYKQDDGVEISFKKEQGERWADFYEKEDKDCMGEDCKLKLKQHVKASLSRHLSSFLDSIQYHYVPAIKDRSYFSHLYEELQITLLKEENSYEYRNAQSLCN